MSDTNAVRANFDDRWHRETHETVQAHDRILRGVDDDPGLGERVRFIERYVNRSEKEIEDEKRRRDAILEEDKRERKANRFQIMLSVWAAILAVVGLLGVTILDHTVWKPAYYAPQSQSTTFNSDGDNSRTTTTTHDKGETPK